MSFFHNYYYNYYKISTVPDSPSFGLQKIFKMQVEETHSAWLVDKWISGGARASSYRESVTCRAETESLKIKISMTRHIATHP